MKKIVDVAIIGAGTAGLNAMTQVREVTDNFVLINGGAIGTTCARVGCMPSKILIQIGDDFHRRHVLAEEGIHKGDHLVVDVSQALSHVRTLRDGFVSGIVQDLINPLGDKYIEGYAEFIAPHVLNVGKDQIQAEKTIIATGSRPVIPDQWRHLTDAILTTDDIFEQRQLPSDMAVIGLGAVGLEIGLALQRLGLNVTGFDQLKQIGGLQDPEVNRAAVEIFGQAFPMHLGNQVEIEKQGDRLNVISGHTSVRVDKILVSVGRVANIDGLHLERLGIQFDDQSIPSFNLETMQIHDQQIFIAGDVNDFRPVLHEVTHEGTVAGYNAVHDPVVAFQRKAAMAICFTDPNICMAGATWKNLVDRRPAVGTARFDGGREKIMMRDHGMIRIYADRKNGKLLGTEMVAHGGEHLAHLLAWSIQQELTVFDLLTMPFYHPTIEETLHTALLDLADAVEHKEPRLIGFYE
ncbi:MAG: dihydrolipoyl dehydrogenase [Desulfosarcina sp.]|jgi:dihydrolipoamide dehydrogenase